MDLAGEFTKNTSTAAKNCCVFSCKQSRENGSFSIFLRQSDCSRDLDQLHGSTKNKKRWNI
jgi:hypothetical protein